MKFDVCVMNPPYNHGLHVDFINMACNISDRVVAVHPSTPIVSMKPTNRSKRDVLLLDTLDKYSSSVTLINGNDHFSAVLEAPISITEIDMTSECDYIIFNGQKVLASKYINLIGQWSMKFYDMIDPNNSIHSHAFGDVNGINDKSKLSGKYFVSQNWKRGGNGFYDTDFYTIVSKNKEVKTEIEDRYFWIHWGFDTKEEADNFLAYIKTKFARFMLALYKVNAHLESGEMKAIPWMDFTQKWNDDKLFNHFNISEEDRKKIIEFIPDYY